MQMVGQKRVIQNFLGDTKVLLLSRNTKNAFMLLPSEKDYFKWLGSNEGRMAMNNGEPPPKNPVTKLFSEYKKIKLNEGDTKLICEVAMGGDGKITSIKSNEADLVEILGNGSHFSKIKLAAEKAVETARRQVSSAIKTVIRQTGLKRSSLDKILEGGFVDAMFLRGYKHSKGGAIYEFWFSTPMKTIEFNMLNVVVSTSKGQNKPVILYRKNGEIGDLNMSRTTEEIVMSKEFELETNFIALS